MIGEGKNIYRLKTAENKDPVFETISTKDSNDNNIRQPLPEEKQIDRLIHSVIGRMSGGVSPVALSIAWYDWWMHNLFSPGRMLELQNSLVLKSLKLAGYLTSSVSGGKPPLVIRPDSSDRRFESEYWQELPFSFYHQAFLLWQEWVREVVTGVHGVSKHHENIAAFVSRQALDIFSPSNSIVTNPDIINTIINKKGSNFVEGLGYLIDDLYRLFTDKPPAGTEEFKVGENIAITPGKIIYRNRLIELIQYTPTTPQVYPEPVFIIPAWIMKYYILDLSPRNSLVKYLVDNGHTVFVISWKNPDSKDRDLGMEEYLELGISESIKAITAIIPDTNIHTVGYCLGGTLLSMYAAMMAREHKNHIKTITLLAAQTDFEEAGELLLFIDESQVAFLEDIMWQQGYLDKHQMSGTFQILRPNDLIWSRLVHDYLQGNRRPMIDLMAWNADSTRMPYRMHSQYLRRLFLHNDLAEGRFIINDKHIMLEDIKLPVFAVSTVRDHVAPWRSVYKIHHLTGGEITFVLTSGGHNAGIVSEPGRQGRTYKITRTPSGAQYIKPEIWEEKAESKEGSWWPAWQEWLAGLSGSKIKPPAIGASDKGYEILCDAPGTYVMQK